MTYKQGTPALVDHFDDPKAFYRVTKDEFGRQAAAIPTRPR